MSDADTAADLAYMRALAEEGRRAPLLGGRFHVWWAVWTALAWVLHGATLAGLTPWGVTSLWVIWLGYGVVGGFVGSLLPRGLMAKPGAGAVGNVAERYVWPAAMAGLGAFALGVIGAAATGRAPWLVVDLIAPAAFVGYGTAFMLTAQLARVGWLKLPAWACYAAALIFPFFVGEPALYPASAMAILVIGAGAGIAMLRTEPPSAGDDAPVAGAASHGGV